MSGLGGFGRLQAHGGSLLGEGRRLGCAFGAGGDGCVLFARLVDGGILHELEGLELLSCLGRWHNRGARDDVMCRLDGSGVAIVVGKGWRSRTIPLALALRISQSAMMGGRASEMGRWASGAPLASGSGQRRTFDA